jgi:shikimate kinase
MLAENLKIPFIDLDARIEEHYAQQHGHEKTFREIYRELGEQEFRKWEHDLIAVLAKEGDLVFSVGGGTVMHEENLRMVRDIGTMIYIQVDADVLYERIMRDGIPAFLDAEKPRESFDRLYSERKPVYEECADLVVDTSGFDIEQSAIKLQIAIETLQGGR